MTFVIPSCYLWVVLYLYRMRIFIYLYTTRSISLGCYQLWILGMCKTNKYITSTSICSCFKTLKKWWPPTLVRSSRSSCRSLNLSCQSWDVYKVVSGSVIFTDMVISHTNEILSYPSVITSSVELHVTLIKFYVTKHYIIKHLQH